MTMMTAIRSAESEAAKGASDKLAEARRLLPADDGLAAFFDALYAGAVPDDILRARPDKLAALALAVWAEAAKRAPGASHVAALELGHETVLVAINDDRPFLFDSALAAAIAGGARLRAAFHPILDIAGRHTSVIALVCDSLAPQAREDLLSSLRDTFAQGDAAMRVVRDAKSGERQGLSAEVRAFLDASDPLIITKSAVRSLVHRRAHMDYIGIKTFGPDGAFVGERRFVGLFTSSTYAAQARSIPLLRRKIEAVMAEAGLDPASHDGKALTHILDTFPRDELFQVSPEELYEIATGILHMGGLPRIRLFLRFDRFDRFVSALLLAPRDHVNAKNRGEIHALLAEALNGRTSAFEAAVDETPLVRLHFIVGRNPGPVPQVY